MVLVNQVVAVHHVLAGEIAKAHQQADGHAPLEHENVLAPSLMGRHAPRALAENAAFLQVNMDGMVPAPLARQFPDFDGT
ncbi:hypothetical protein D3C78_1926280 [compost metagenome]